MRTTFPVRWALGVLAVAAAAQPAPGRDELLLLVRNAPPHGLVVAPIRRPGPQAPSLTAEAKLAGKRIDAQVLDALGESEPLVVLRLGRAGDGRVALTLTPGAAKPPPAKLDVRAAGATFSHVSGQAGAGPRRVVFPGGKRFETFAWNDRVHDPKLGGFLLRNDAGARIERVSRGPICTAVRTRARYVKPNGERPASRPEAVYQWVYFHDRPLVLVRAAIRQDKTFAWRELHFLEWNYPDKSFVAWAGGEPAKTGSFAASGKSFGFDDWALLRDGPAAVAMLGAGKMMFHDGRGAYGTYLHACATAAWHGWRDRRQSYSAWLWAGESDDAPAAVRRAVAALPTEATVVTTRAGLRRDIEAAQTKLGGTERTGSRRYELAMAEKLEAAGEWDQARTWLAGRTPTGWSRLVAGDLAVTFQRTDGGVRCRSLLDLAQAAELAGADPGALFTVTFRHTKTHAIRSLSSDAGWSRVAVRPGSGRIDLTFSAATDAALAKVSVSATALADAARSGLDWTLSVANDHDDWGVWRVAFPRVSLGRFAPDVRVLVQQGAGVVKPNVFRKGLRTRGTYPSGWTSMQFLAAYAADGRTGLYAAAHDPNACTKDLLAETDTRRRQITLAFDWPAPNMGRPRAGFALSGTGRWQLLRGDWFDAASIYRDWVRRKAPWWPALGDVGRADTPRWMRELCLWGMLSGPPDGATRAGKRFAEVMGMPVGFHWYNWHAIPFDNDYPHYFPAKKGFRKAVSALQSMPKSPAYIMPYINGRLWDTRDRGTADFEFTKLARAAATKDEHGKVRTETYGSKETDGSKVTLAAMCPATELWRGRVKGIVLKLMRDCGTKAVYIDQIAAAKPRLCFDASHGHPIGGGSWWPEAYGKLLGDLREAMPAGCVLTTECNAEPYVRWFDGYLTWHWQYDGQVPAFPAVYGGAIQMFGRAYRGGPTRARALRMKAGQQLVFGEQIGWIGADVASRELDAAFLRKIARLRRRLVRYFHAGQMARPPKLAGPLPTVTADWQWSGVWPVTTDAVLTGAWELPKDKKLVLLFANVSPKPVTASLTFDASAHGLDAAALTLRRITADAAGPAEDAPARFTRKVPFPPDDAWAWEIRPKHDMPERR